MLIITIDKDILNLSLLKESLREKYNARSPSFYELTFNIKSPETYKEITNRKGNTLPGLITYLFFLAHTNFDNCNDVLLFNSHPFRILDV